MVQAAVVVAVLPVELLMELAVELQQNLVLLLEQQVCLTGLLQQMETPLLRLHLVLVVLAVMQRIVVLQVLAHPQEILV